MATVSTFENGITIRKIFNTTTDFAIEELTKHINNGLINPQDFDSVSIDYSCFRGVPDARYDNPDYFPVKFKSTSNDEEVWLSAVSAGYRGEGPHGTIKALQLMGFDLNIYQQEQIFNTKEVHFVFVK